MADDEKPKIQLPSELEVRMFGGEAEPEQIKVTTGTTAAKAEDQAINFVVWKEVGVPIVKPPSGWLDLDKDWNPEDHHVLDEDGIKPGDVISYRGSRAATLRRPSVLMNTAVSTRWARRTATPWSMRIAGAASTSAGCRSAPTTYVGWRGSRSNVR